MRSVETPFVYGDWEPVEHPAVAEAQTLATEAKAEADALTTEVGELRRERARGIAERWARQALPGASRTAARGPVPALPPAPGEVISLSELRAEPKPEALRKWIEEGAR